MSKVSASNSQYVENPPDTLLLQVQVETQVGNKRVDIYTVQQDSGGISDRMRVIDIRAFELPMILQTLESRSDMEDPGSRSTAQQSIWGKN